MAWKKILLEGDASSLSDEVAHAITGAAASAGVATDASRHDHIHALGPLVADLDFGLNEALSIAIENSAGAVDVGSEVSGQLYFNTGDKHLYLWQVP